MLGAQVRPEGVAFRVWTPASREVHVVLESDGSAHPLRAEPSGFFSGMIAGLRAGARYRYRLDNGRDYADPCSRFQPEGPDGPSMVVDPAAYHWKDQEWTGLGRIGQVYYELHIGTFTPEGTFDAAVGELAALRAFGITAIELMPVVEWPGRWNWGYDGVDLFAPSHRYGDPEALKRFVDQAHAAGLGAIMDVVYNHFGPDACHLGSFSPNYFTDRYENEWGQAINFDGPGAGPVREFFLENASYWIREFHLDGLRLDATQSIFDSRKPHILSELSQAARSAAWPRHILLVAENEPQNVRCLAPVADDGFGMDAVWNDDFHHAARVAATGFREAYYMDYRGRPQELIDAVKSGYLFQGQYYQWQKKPRGTPVTTEPASAFIIYLQNHDQVANQVPARRLTEMIPAARYRALAALWLLAPESPMFFMGQEFGAESPFHYFADHGNGLRQVVWDGRRKFLGQFPTFAQSETAAQIPDPADERTFLESKVSRARQTAEAPLYLLHKDLLALRRSDPVIAAQRRDRLDGAWLAQDAFALRYLGDSGGDRLLVVNLGPEVSCEPTPQPLIAPPRGHPWRLAWSSEAVRYGGSGAGDPRTEGAWDLPADCAFFFEAHADPNAAAD